MADTVNPSAFEAATASRAGRNVGARKRKGFLSAEEVTAWLLVGPWVLGFLLLTLGPMLASMVLSFTDYPVLRPPTWVGLQNYATLLHDGLVGQSLKVTTIYAASAVPLGIASGFFVALLLNQPIKGRAFVRTVYYLPACVSGVAVALVWLMIFRDPDGLLNSLLRMVGIEGPNWLMERQAVLPAFVLMSLWGVGAGAIIYLAGLQGIPTELYEAAQIDGAGEWTRFRHVTLPMMSPILYFELVMGIMGALQTFSGPFIMTNGGPANASLFYMLHLYRNAFRYLRMGYGSALAWVLFWYIMALTLLVIRSSSLWVFYAGEGKSG